MELGRPTVCRMLLHSLLLLCFALAVLTEDDLRLQVVTIATEKTDGYHRFMRSSRLFDLNVEVVGLGEQWRGGDVVRYPGGGQKVNLLRPVLEQWKHQRSTIVMFVDSYDVVFVSGVDVILQRFKDFNARVVFSAESFCWPDQSLAAQYPRVGLGKRFLNSGGFIGYAPDIYDIVSDHAIGDAEDDQLYYTLIYLDKDKRSKYDMRLDHRAHIFQNLNGAKDEVEIKMQGNVTYAYNSIYDTRATMYHGNGPSKIYLNNLANYIPNAWNNAAGCTVCESHDLPSNRSEWPLVMLALFIEKPTPFLAEVLERVTGLDYPKHRMRLWVHTLTPYHDALVGAWFELVSSDYNGSSYVSSDQQVGEVEARKTAMEVCVQQSCDFLFMLDSVAMLDHAHTLQRLIEVERNVVAPLLVRPYRLFSNFWGDVASNGFYARSRDYQDIAERSRLGVWNVPHISSAILFSGLWLRAHRQNLPSYTSEEWEPDMALAAWMREKGHFMFVNNLYEYGHLLNNDNFDTSHLNNDMYQLFDNRMDWESKYVHEKWHQVLEPEYDVQMPCPDVYWYPLMSDVFCKELVEEMEHFGQWSGGSHEDKRLSGGYENVPTQDIHMNQVGFEQHWLEFIRSYVVPVQIKVYPGYYSKGHAIMNFVVRYHTKGQTSLRPHHDSSTFTINVALNQPKVDYMGGGCRFLRYNCSVVDSRLGWATMHPGRLTHYHEGLPITSGTRYIMVSFIDP